MGMGMGMAGGPPTCTAVTTTWKRGVSPLVHRHREGLGRWAALPVCGHLTACAAQGKLPPLILRLLPRFSMQVWGTLHAEVSRTARRIALTPERDTMPDLPG